MSTSSVETATKPRLLFFYSAKDGRARRVQGYLAQVLQRRGNHQTFAVDPIATDGRPDLVERFRLTGAPTLMVVADRSVRGRLEAPRGCAEIQELLAPWLH